MMIHMKNTLLINILLLALVSVNIANAALYKGLDSEGNVIYSDKSFDDAEKFTPPPISVMDAPKTNAEKKMAEEKPKEFKYMAFDIVSPEANATIRNSDVSVSLSLKPRLDTEKNHSIWMLVDGKAVVENTQSFSLQLGRLNRGAHKLQAQVRDGKGKIIVRTRTTVIFVHQTLAL
ncbi:hypothetical protein MNBD_GAMMA06-673 [hydrothermal vent metagenome]|uniref:DUF4124 domain-containing protein n=1 Tax=hydrothermal vent metagenome TaxID=652676 RepID=A0A3B0W690_9ZZZZ